MPELREHEIREPQANDYWLGHCHGFRVEAAGRRVGVVEDVLYGAQPGRVSALAVRGGLFGGRLELVPVEAVERVEARHKRIWLESTA
jgi:uncharacterized protein YrrD